jgi:hypothetical protein
VLPGGGAELRRRAVKIIKINNLWIVPSKIHWFALDELDRDLFVLRFSFDGASYSTVVFRDKEEVIDIVEQITAAIEELGR